MISMGWQPANVCIFFSISKSTVQWKLHMYDAKLTIQNWTLHWILSRKVALATKYWSVQTILKLWAYKPFTFRYSKSKNFEKIKTLKHRATTHLCMYLAIIYFHVGYGVSNSWIQNTPSPRIMRIVVPWKNRVARKLRLLYCTVWFN